MNQKTWLITGISSGFGYELTRQLLENGNNVIGTIQKESETEKIRFFYETYPNQFEYEVLDIRDTYTSSKVVETAFKKHTKVDVVVSNAGYGLYGAAEEVTKKEIDDIISANLIGSIMFIKHTLPYLRKQGGGRIIQISSYEGQVATPGSSIYNATKFGIEGFCEALSGEVSPFGIGVTIIEPGKSRTSFEYASVKTTGTMSEYDISPAHDYLTKTATLSPGNPTLVAARIIESANINPAPLRVILGKEAIEETITTLESRLAIYKSQIKTAPTIDYNNNL
ncbi:MAG: SDR family NAD(P)-dependent oxidoreductase [Bacilli bacterium]|nr:SDR family NAD(P)-dependent oxidoreductase [Bacilli bacterium]